MVPILSPIVLRTARVLTALSFWRSPFFFSGLLGNQEKHAKWWYKLQVTRQLKPCHGLQFFHTGKVRKNSGQGPETWRDIDQRSTSDPRWAWITCTIPSPETLYDVCVYPARSDSILWPRYTFPDNAHAFELPNAISISNQSLMYPKYELAAQTAWHHASYSTCAQKLILLNATFC